MLQEKFLHFYLLFRILTGIERSELAILQSPSRKELRKKGEDSSGNPSHSHSPRSAKQI